MNYIIELMPIFPLVFLVVLIIYVIIFIFLRENREKPTISTMLAEFVLVGWLVVFIYVTQIKSFGNGMGELFNLNPLHMFYVAFRYGSNNAGMVWQFLLNILMFVPLGLLLPVVFPYKCRTWLRIILISFCATLTTELLQLISRRGTDIDDVIANTIGGLCGFALFLFGYGLVSLIKRRRMPPPNFVRKFIGGVCVIATVAGVFIAVKCSDGSSKYGNLYYGNMQPYTVKIDDSVSNRECVRNIYQYTEHIALSELQHYLQEASGFTGQFTEDGGLYTLADGDDRRIFIYSYNTWSVTYSYGEEREANPPDIPDEEKALTLSWRYLENYGITADAVRYKADISNTYGDNYRHLEFVSCESTDNTLVYGTVSMTLGENGRLVEIDDSRRWCEFIVALECISPRDSIGIVQDVGVGEWNGIATVTIVDEGYSFIDETGYLIPIWDISAKMQSASGEEYDWSPVVDAIK